MKILVVTTSSAHFGGPTGHPTGVWLEEFTVPYMAFLEAGADLTVASPLGGAMPIDPRTLPNDQQRLDWAPALAAAEHTHALPEMQADGFDAIFIPGGHGPMFDLPDDPDLQRLLTEFHSAGKLISSVCHGPCAFVNARRADGEFLVYGVSLTSYTASEEVAAKLDKEVPFILEDRLRQCGANFIARENKADHIERDGQFITGQNPASSASLARAVVAALQKQFAPIANTVPAPLCRVETIAEFPVGTFVENIAVFASGEIYVSSLDEGKIYVIDAHRQVEEFAPLPRVAGLAFGPAGDLYASASIGSTAPGIYRVGRGKAECVVPLPDATFLNGMVHLDGDRFLVADSYRSIIWEANIKTGAGQVWLEHPSLAHASDPFHPVPQFPGVNGIKIFGHTLYVSSTEQQKLIKIPLREDGLAGAPEVFMTSINLDDFAFDEAGNLYGATHVYNSVVKINPARVVTIVAGEAEGLAGSTAAAFGRTAADRATLYVTTNGGMSAPPAGGVQPGRVVAIQIGAL